MHSDATVIDTDGDGFITYSRALMEESVECTYTFSTHYKWHDGTYDHNCFSIKAPNVKEAARALRLMLMNMRYLLLDANVFGYTYP